MKPAFSQQDQRHFDVVITGGAMTGATLALALNHLTQGKIRIALVEAQPIEHEHAGFDARSIALSYGSCTLLNKFGLWQSLAPAATPIKQIHVSDKGYIGITEFDADEAQLDFLGQVIELADAGQIFYRKLEQATNITVFCPAQITAIDRQIDFCALVLSDGAQFTTKLLVAADGGQSASCEMLGITRQEHHFQQSAIISNVMTEKRHQFRAFERFTAQGPIALLPMSKQRSSLVWCCSQEKAKKIMEFDKNEFLTELQHHFGWRLGKFTQSSLPHCYPLVLRQADKIVSHRFVVLGNAAQTLHPIAGQGFNLALRDVVTLATKVANAFKQNKDFGEMATLQSYRAEREADRKKTISLISSLVYGFSNNSLPLVGARNLGLLAMSRCKELKKPLMHQMMGLS